jgi:hypothetical protein
MRISLASRLTVLVGIGAGLPTLLACLNHPLKDVKYEQTSEKQNAIQLTVNKDVDILFVIDNSGSMGEEQGLLAQNFPAFIGVLEDPEVKANYRIGVTTTDNGNPWCGSTSPEAGKLQLSSCRGRTGQFVFNGNPPADATAVACTDVCSTDNIEILPTTTEFDPEPAPRPWLENIEGKTNLAGELTTTEAFQCFGPQGIAGCGFESHLESMYKAFLRANDDKEDQFGFLRSNAILSIVHVTDEVDCSYNNAHQSIFLPADEGGAQTFWSDPTASAPTSAVCWNAGVVCEGSGTPYDSCRSVNKGEDGSLDVSDGDAVLHPLSRYTSYVQELEAAKQEITPSQEVLVAVIGGVPPEYDGELTYSNSLNDTEQNDFGIGAGCEYDDGDPTTPLATARPPVRLREFAEEFQVGSAVNLYSICQESYTDALEAIAETIRDQIKPACMTACVADTDQVTAGVQPQCTLIQEAPDVESGSVVETDIKRCNAGGELPEGEDVCFNALVDDGLSEYCSDLGWNLEFQLVRRDGVPAPGGTSVSATCQLSQNKDLDCPNLP